MGAIALFANSKRHVNQLISSNNLQYLATRKRIQRNAYNCLPTLILLEHRYWSLFEGDRWSLHSTGDGNDRDPARYSAFTWKREATQAPKGKRTDDQQSD